MKTIETCQLLEDSFSVIVRDCMKLNPYSIITRYPSELELIENDATSAIISAEKIGELVKSIISSTANKTFYS